jgi:hypothetical protein
MSVKVGGSARYNAGSFSDAVSLQALIDGGEKLIILGAGTYVVGAGLSVPAGVTLKGDGSEATVLEYNGAGALSTLVALAVNARIAGIKLVRTGAGVVTNGVRTSGDGASAIDVKASDMSIRVENDLCRVERCRVDLAADGIVVAGDRNVIIHSILNACIRSIYVPGDGNIVESNTAVGDGTSTRGIHLDGACNFNHIRNNTIRDILSAAPGFGIDLEATGDSNQIANNIFSGTFGAKAIRATGSVPATTQLLGNQTIGVSPPSARISLADFGGATGIGNT